MSTSHKATFSKRQREQDQKERAAERIARRGERKARAAARVASGQVGPQIAEPVAPEGDELERDPASLDANPGAAPPPRERGPISKRLYVGNLSFDTDSASVRALFANHGEVTDVHLAMDHVTGRPRGFAFVTMSTAAEAQQAMAEIDGQTIGGRQLRVNEAEARDSRGPGRPSPGRGRY